MCETSILVTTRYLRWMHQFCSVVAKITERNWYLEVSKKCEEKVLLGHYQYIHCLDYIRHCVPITYRHKTKKTMILSSTSLHDKYWLI